MKRIFAAMALAAVIAGCTGSPGQPADTGKPGNDQPGTQQPVDQPPGGELKVPTPAEACIMPDDQSGIEVWLHKGQSDSTHVVRDGWVVPFPGNFFFANVVFPQGTALLQDSGSVQSDNPVWQIKRPGTIPAQNMYSFQVLPDGEMKWGPPGWLTITIADIKDAEGKPLLTEPISFKLWLYGYESPDRNPTYVPCEGFKEKGVQ